METIAKRGTILFVDDEPRVLTSMRAMFRRDYEVLLAGSGQEAIDLLRDHSVDVIVSDQRMPGMTGVEVLKAVKRLAPHAMRILLTGYADLKAIEASINEGEVFRYLTKPCPSEELKEAIGLAADIAANGDAAAPEVTHESKQVVHETVHVRPGMAQPAQSAPPSPPDTLTRPAPPSPTGTLMHPAMHPAPTRRPLAAPLTPIARRPAHKPEVRRGDGARGRSGVAQVDLLVLTRDARMLAAIASALDGSHRLHHAETLDAAVAALEAHPIGVLVTDTAVSEEEIATLTTTLKRHVPELVTIVASSRSDARLLIDLINYGQIFRFLVKPLHGGQCRLSVESAVVKHRQLAADPALHRRHAVAERVVAADGRFSAVFGRIRALRDRFLTLNGTA